MNKLKHTLIVGAGIGSIGIAGIAGITTASALTGGDSSTGTSLIDKLASKFSLNKDEVKTVFDENRTEHRAEVKAKREAALTAALSDGKLTQVQYDYIVAAQADIEASFDSSVSPREQSDETKALLKTKFEALKTWMTEQNLKPRDLGLGHEGRGDHGPGRGGDTSSTDKTD